MSLYLIIQTNLKLRNKEAPIAENVMSNEDSYKDFKKHVRQHSNRGDTQSQNIIIENAGITVSINDKHYYIP